METHLPRREILRLVRGLLGLQTDSGLAAAVSEQRIAATQLAASEVATDCRWVTAQREVTVNLGMHQEVLDYPSGTAAGAILAMAVYDGVRYIPLESRIIPVTADTDQELVAGGDTLAAVVGRPWCYEQRAQIRLFPRSNLAYPVRISYVADLTLPLDTSVSIVDATLIVYKAAEMLSAQMSDDARVGYYAAKYAARLGDLRAWQSSNTTFPLDSEADLSEDEAQPYSSIPNWDRSPTPPVA